MQITDLTLRLVLLFVPGLIAFLILAGLIAHRDWKAHGPILGSLLLGFASYALLHLLSRIPCWRHDLSFLRALTDTQIPLNYVEILWAMVAAVPIGLAAAWIHNFKLLYRVAHALRVSKQIGEPSIWTYVMDSTNEWVVVRDVGNDLMYEGWISAYSEGAVPMHELLLRDVRVCRNSTGATLYRVSALYVCRARGSLLLEFPSL